MAGSPAANRGLHSLVLAAPFLILGFSAFLGSCASFEPPGQSSYWHPVANPYPATNAAQSSSPERPVAGAAQQAPLRATEDPAVVALRAKLVEGARSVIGSRDLSIRGRRFTMDCTGTVLAIYWYAGIDLSQDFSRLKGSGVSRIYQTLQRRNLLYTTAHPLSGDIIFWDNTYDEDGFEGQPNPLSHMGMVVSVDQGGTIAYVHYHIRRGITIDSMNLESPDVQSTDGERQPQGDQLPAPPGRSRPAARAPLACRAALPRHGPGLPPGIGPEADLEAGAATDAWPMGAHPQDRAAEQTQNH